jgi:hypothetical protein
MPAGAPLALVILALSGCSSLEPHPQVTGSTWSEAFGPDGDTGDSWLAVQHPERVAGVLLIPNDQSYFSYYDHVLAASVMVGAIPARHRAASNSTRWTGTSRWRAAHRTWRRWR